MTDTLTISGSVAPGFERVRDALADLLATGEETGAQFAATLGGHTIIDLWCGEKPSPNEPGPVTPDTLIPIYSVSKAVSALVVAVLVEEGALDYETPVAKVWPEFAAHGKGAITLAELMSHQAGLPGLSEPMNPEDWYDWDFTAGRLAAMAPLWPPGERSGYHPISWGHLVGEVVRRATGRTIGEHLRTRFAEPFDLDVWIGVAPDQIHRAATPRKPPAPPDLGEINEPTTLAFLKRWSTPRNARSHIADWLTKEIPAANGHGTARGLARLMQPFARAGRLDGASVLSADTLMAATRERIAGPDLVLPFDMSWSAGLTRNTAHPPRHSHGPGANTVGHTGFGGTYAFADPDAELTCAYATLKLGPALLEDPRALKLMAVLYDAL